MDEQPLLKFTYLLPVHNESQILAKTVERLKNGLLNRGLAGRAQILLVENGSRDHSAQIADSLMSTDRSLPVHVHHEASAGLGLAYRVGITQAIRQEHWEPSWHWIVLAAADLPFEFSDFDRFLAIHPGESGLLMAAGSKAHPESVVLRSRKRILFTWIYRMFRRDVLGMKTGDSQGTIFVRSDIAARLLPWIASRDYFFTTELVFLAEQAGIIPLELPVRYAGDKRKSSVRPVRDGIKMLKQLILMKLKTLFFRHTEMKKSIEKQISNEQRCPNQKNAALGSTTGGNL